MKKSEFSVRNVAELAEILGLEAADAIEIEFRAKLNKKIIDTVKARGLTHVQAAKLARTSRTRITAILNGNTSGVSSDLLLRVLYALGYKAKVTFAPVQLAA